MTGLLGSMTGVLAVTGVEGMMGWVWDLVTTLPMETSSCVTGTAGVNGITFLRNLLFLCVSCRLPWIFTM